MEPKDSFPFSLELATGRYLSQINPVDTLTVYDLKIRFNFILPCMTMSSK
jgi:hypothetical protein